MNIRFKDNWVQVHFGATRHYTMVKSNLAAIYDIEGSKICSWIFTLLGDPEVELAPLYDLARLIQRLHPKNDINWLATFKIVEFHMLAFQHLKEIMHFVNEKNSGIYRFMRLDKREQLKQMDIDDIIEKKLADKLEDKIRITLSNYKMT